MIDATMSFTASLSTQVSPKPAIVIGWLVMGVQLQGQFTRNFHVRKKYDDSPIAANVTLGKIKIFYAIWLARGALIGLAISELKRSSHVKSTWA